MHVYGIAREYKVVGEDKMKISWLYGQRSKEAQIIHTSLFPQPNTPYLISSPTPKN